MYAGSVVADGHGIRTALGFALTTRNRAGLGLVMTVVAAVSLFETHHYMAVRVVTPVTAARFESYRRRVNSRPPPMEHLRRAKPIQRHEM